MIDLPATTILTTTRSVVLVQLSSGNTAMVDYSLSAGDVLVATLLTVLVIISSVQLWRGR
jgi:hypothetical protein